MKRTPKYKSSTTLTNFLREVGMLYVRTFENVGFLTYPHLASNRFPSYYSVIDT